MQNIDLNACAADLFSAEKDGVEYFIFSDDFSPELCDFMSKIQMAMSRSTDRIRTYVESNSNYIGSFGKLDGEQKDKLFLHPQVYIFAGGGVITWIGDKKATNKMISVNFAGVLDRLGEVEILDA